MEPLSGTSLRLGWWNTHLHGMGVGAPEVELARAVLDEMFGANQCAAVALCEVDPSLDRALSGSDLDTRRSDDPHEHVVVLFDPVRVGVEFTRTLRTMRGDRNDRAATFFALEPPGLIPFTLAACHWFALGNRGDQDDVRQSHLRCGGDLLQELMRDGADGAAVVLGDFNEEPFDGALRAISTRDRGRVRHDLLYNLSWRWLGSKEPFDAASSRGETSAGTYLLRNGYDSRWRTLDQALVSQSLLRGSGWTLREAESGPILPGSLRGRRGAILRSEFDHLPLMLSLEYISPEAPEASP